MNLSTIRTFLSIIETGQLNKAAEQLNVTQSTVTARLNSLEQELGQSLFHRRKSGAELTSAGFRFERYAQLMVDVWRQAKQETALPTHIESICNFGCAPDLWPNLGERLINRIRESEKSIALSAWSGEQHDLNKWLDSGLIDAALCYMPSLREDRTVYPINNERLLLVSTRPRELMRWDPEYVYVDGGEEFRKSHAEAYPDGETPTMTMGSAIWAKHHLLNYGGSGYLPARLADPEIRKGKLHLVPGAPEFTRNSYLVVNNNLGDFEWLSQYTACLSESRPLEQETR